MWVQFNKAYDYTPADKRNVSLRYQAGKPYNVPTPCGEKAIAEGAAIKISREGESDGRSSEDEQSGEVQAASESATERPGRTWGQGS